MGHSEAKQSTWAWGCVSFGFAFVISVILVFIAHFLPLRLLLIISFLTAGTFVCLYWHSLAPQHSLPRVIITAIGGTAVVGLVILYGSSRETGEYTFRSIYDLCFSLVAIVYFVGVGCLIQLLVPAPKLPGAKFPGAIHFDMALPGMDLGFRLREYPNSIRILPSPHPICRYTCLMHVFDFVERQEYLDIASRFCQIYASPEFAKWLLDQRFVNEVPKSNVKNGDLVFYFCCTQFKHAGLVSQGGRVISKWGRGHLYEHELFDVPESYGSEVRFFSPLSYEDTFCYFCQFSEEKMIQLGYTAS